MNKRYLVLAQSRSDGSERSHRFLVYKRSISILSSNRRDNILHKRCPRTHRDIGIIKGFSCPCIAGINDIILIGGVVKCIISVVSFLIKFYLFSETF